MDWRSQVVEWMEMDYTKVSGSKRKYDDKDHVSLIKFIRRVDRLPFSGQE